MQCAKGGKYCVTMLGCLFLNQIKGCGKEVCVCVWLFELITGSLLSTVQWIDLMNSVRFWEMRLFTFSSSHMRRCLQL